jgi:hypothetical protein
MKHQRHEDQLDDQEVRPVEKELQDQTEDGEIALLRREIRGNQRTTPGPNADDDMNGLHQQIEDFR